MFPRPHWEFFAECDASASCAEVKISLRSLELCVWGNMLVHFLLPLKTEPQLKSDQAILL